MFTPHWAGVVGFYGFLPPGKQFSDLLSPGGQGRLHAYFLLEEWVCFG